MSNLDVIKERLARVPREPGVYLWKNSAGEILYVGKAKELRSRMSQYVQGSDERAKIPYMMAQVESFDYVVCRTETEALVLEKNLIKQYNPPFNDDFTDDKSYPFIAITAGDIWPAIKYTREKHVSGTHYFGPYTNSRAARELVEAARRIVPICSAQCAAWRRLNRQDEAHQLAEANAGNKPCFDFHVGKGPGPCCGLCTREDYEQNVKRIERFLSGHRKEFIDAFTAEMTEAAAELDFERAARCRNRIEAILALKEKQTAVTNISLDTDVFGVYREDGVLAIQVLVVREGSIIIANEFVSEQPASALTPEVLENFLARYYKNGADIPREILVEEFPSDYEFLEEYLTSELASKHGAKVHFSIPTRGQKADVLKLATKNAQHALMRYKVRTHYDDERINMAMLELETALALPCAPMRIECYDISTMHGKYSVASMVVFTDGKPDKSAYRRFKMRLETDEANDFAMMEETLRRRFAPERVADERFGKLPDLLVVDGGKPQLTAALNILHELGLDIPVTGLAKRDEELYVDWNDGEPIILMDDSASLNLIKHVRDEAHRFAITFHRELRGKSMKASILDEIEGIGPKRKKALMKEFGSIRKMRMASVEELAKVPGISDELAKNIKQAFDDFEKAGIFNALKR